MIYYSVEDLENIPIKEILEKMHDLKVINDEGQNDDEYIFLADYVQARNHERIIRQLMLLNKKLDNLMNMQNEGESRAKNYDEFMDEIIKNHYEYATLEERWKSDYHTDLDDESSIKSHDSSFASDVNPIANNENPKKERIF